MEKKFVKINVSYKKNLLNFLYFNKNQFIIK